jgi:hypothetical protein
MIVKLDVQSVFIFSCWCLIIQVLMGVAWWQRAWDLHRRSRVRVMTCISYKSLEQPEFYSLTWTHKIRFSGGGVSSNQKQNTRMSI